MDGKGTSPLIPYGLNADGVLVKAQDVPNGAACGCVCPGCEAPLQARQGDIRRWHFAHHPPAKDCGVESWLHKTAVRILYNRFRIGLSDHTEVRLEYSCSCLCGKHQGNVLKSANAVAMESRIETSNIQPDVRLINNGKTVVLVEVVVTHAPEPPVVEWATSHGRPLLEFHLSEAADLEKLETIVIRPDKLQGMGIDSLCPCSKRLCRCGRPSCPKHTCCRPPCNLIDGPEHDHCLDCGTAIWEREYIRCYCCYLARRLGRVPCYQRGLSPDSHRHCMLCHREMMGMRAYLYDNCYRCNQRKSVQANNELESRAERWRRASRSERVAMLAEPIPVEERGRN